LLASIALRRLTVGVMQNPNHIPSPSTATAERFEKVIPTSTLVNDSNKDFCRIVLEAIKDPKNPICKRSIMKNGFSFFVDVECYDDGFVSKVSLFTEETKINGILTAYGNKRFLPTDQSNVYEVKTGSHSFKTPSELKEFSVAFDLMHTLLECLKNAELRN
jgi:hypothetical protein